MERYAVLTRTLCGWEDCWHEEDKPWRFDTVEEANDEIDDFIMNLAEAVADANMDGVYDRDDYLVVPVSKLNEYVEGVV